MNTLREAKSLYEEGLIEEIPHLLSGCMESGFTRAQRIEAYKLIILAYLFDDDQFQAEKTMDEFLKKFPEYEVMPNDPVEFVYLLESYKTASVYSFNFMFGPVFSNQRITEHYSLMGVNKNKMSDQIGTGFQVGTGMSRNIWKALYVNIEGYYTWHSYGSTEEGIITFRNTEGEFATITVKEKLNKIDVPLSLTYKFDLGKLNYFLSIGGMASFVQSAILEPERSQPAINESIPGGERDIKQHRQEICYSAVAGMGLEYKIPRGFIVLDIRHHMGLNNMVITDERYSSPRLQSGFFYLDDDFSLDYLSINIGYHFSIYQSKKDRR
ncbi:MAG: hypothetical protein JW894_07445 [Bacteroidales bacterium]|nr:hypothetical protein [Bacteroidales bacterium]